MDKDVNNYHKGEWGQMEKNWAEKISEGKQVDVKIEPIYSDNSARPSSFKITEVIDEVINKRTIIN
ncbi:DNA/RNA non-specific endonuclease [Capnocytophaga canimorsus]|uniref:DNA/RNA non-specific endonuclease n=1 Tax=Capnocytophaga canimorsus TaxID=28188 RepID=UPI0019D59EEC|nr:DNA/RNA non-specific endonuclease [Capnocytophaga canimorsus]